MNRVVLVHGVADRASNFAEVVAALPPGPVLTYDRRGCGERWRQLPDSLQQHIDDLLHVIGDQPAAVVGHSLGGVIALGAALRRPDLVGAVGLFETAIPWAPWWSAAQRQAMISDMERTAASALQSAAHSELPRQRAVWAATRRDVSALLEEPFPWLEVTVPVRVALGTRSRGRSAADAPRVAVALGTPVTRIDGAGHSAHRTHPAQFAGFVREVAK